MKEVGLEPRLFLKLNFQLDQNMLVSEYFWIMTQCRIHVLALKLHTQNSFRNVVWRCNCESSFSESALMTSQPFFHFTVHLPCGHHFACKILSCLSHKHSKFQHGSHPQRASFRFVDKKYVPWISGASLVAQLVKNPPVIQETPVRFLGQEDLLEKG